MDSILAIIIYRIGVYDNNGAIEIPEAIVFYIPTYIPTAFA